MKDYKPHRCDFCTGTVEGVIARSEPIHVRGGVVLLEGMIVGKCDHCGHRCFPAALAKEAERAAEHPEQASRVAHEPIIAA